MAHGILICLGAFASVALAESPGTGSAGYAMEEMRAELARAFISGELGIPDDISNHASYIQNWLKPLKDDKREIFRAAADAQKIVDWILNYHPAYAARLAPSRPDPSKPCRSASVRPIGSDLPKAVLRCPSSTP